MDRRDFIKQSCSLCVAVSAGLVITSISSCSTIGLYKTEISDNKIKVPVSLFAKSELQIIQPAKFEFNIALRKEKNETYSALLLRCTHADNQLTSTGNGFVCNLHGSKFDMEGAVTKGPAEYPLKRYVTEVIDANIIISV
ncbi:MAG: Rieske (2Fe-2S) protein [Bacteroidia bacterium]